LNDGIVLVLRFVLSLSTSLFFPDFVDNISHLMEDLLVEES